MAKKKAPTNDSAKSASKEKQRKPTRWARVRILVAKQLDELVKRNNSDFTEEANAAIREKLVREGLWPPPSS